MYAVTGIPNKARGELQSGPFDPCASLWARLSSQFSSVLERRIIAWVTQRAESPRGGWCMKTFRILWLILIAVHAIVAAPARSEAASAAQINADVNATFHSFVDQIGGARQLANKAAGILVFPSVVKAGIGFGGEYGEGLLLVHQRPAGYYNLISASFGFQLGVQERSVIIMFMTDEALAGFDRTAGWKVGVDGSVAIVTLGVGGSIDTDQITSPVIGFILDPKGLMYNLTLEGSKISRISR
jgi:lipid-binding SYLF domain-containing protein